jgi:CRISPR-associated protein Csb2
VIQALRHAGIKAQVEEIRVQREPFETNGARAEAFSLGTRFAKERVWHVEISFKEPVLGPLVIGDGRFLGLGLMVPIYQRASSEDHEARRLPEVSTRTPEEEVEEENDS